MVYPEPVADTTTEVTQPTETPTDATTVAQTATDVVQTETTTTEPATTDSTAENTNTETGTEAPTTEAPVTTDNATVTVDVPTTEAVTPTDASVSGTVFYKDGINKIPVATMQAIDQNNNGVFEQPIAEGIFKIENLTDDKFMLNVLVNGISVGSVTILLSLGENVKDVTTN